MLERVLSAAVRSPIHAERDSRQTDSCGIRQKLDRIRKSVIPEAALEIHQRIGMLGEVAAREPRN